jgi:hypothetical protein
MNRLSVGWIDVERDAYFAQGDHGQYISVDPTADVVVVRHRRNVTSTGSHSSTVSAGETRVRADLVR